MSREVGSKGTGSGEAGSRGAEGKRALQDWLGEGEAAEGDWGGAVTRLAMRRELGSGGEGILLDLPALSQPFACTTGACTPGMRTPKSRSCCADLDVTLTGKEEAAITAVLPEIAAWMEKRDPRWPVGGFVEEGVLRRPGRRCIFAVPGEAGLSCGLHAIEIETGRPRGTLKPMPCRLFPLVVVDLGGQVLITAVTRKNARSLGLPPASAFPCLRGDSPVGLTESVRDTIEELWGRKVWKQVERAVRGWNEARS